MLVRPKQCVVTVVDESVFWNAGAILIDYSGYSCSGVCLHQPGAVQSKGGELDEGL